MKKYCFLLFVFSTLCATAQTKLLSWNIENFGKSKTETTIAFVANTVKNYDIIAIQEVVAGPGGPQAVARLADALNRTGTKWDYTISDPTSSSAYKTERYAFLWKTATIKKIGKAWLEKKYHLQIDREPYFCTFEFKGNQFTVANFHAITKSKQPETEIKYFKFLPLQYADLNLVFVGDFNCPQSHSVFSPLKKMGYAAMLTNQKTSLRQRARKDDCLASEFDNVFYNKSKIKVVDSGVLLFYKNCKTFESARDISDHIPIWCEFLFR